MYIKNKRGQSTVEYVLLVTAVIAVIIVMVTNNSTGLRGQLNSTLNQAVGDITTIGGTLSDSHQPTNATGSGTPVYSVPVIPVANQVG